MMYELGQAFIDQWLRVISQVRFGSSTLPACHQTKIPFPGKCPGRYQRATDRRDPLVCSPLIWDCCQNEDAIGDWAGMLMEPEKSYQPDCC